MSRAPVVRFSGHFKDRLLERFGLTLTEATSQQLVLAIQAAEVADPQLPGDTVAFYECRVGSTRFVAIYKYDSCKIVTCTHNHGRDTAARYYARVHAQAVANHERRLRRAKAYKRRHSVFADQRRQARKARWKQSWPV